MDVAMKVSSSAFGEGEMIPTRHTCKGENISPPLQWRDVPVGTECFALLVTDPDAPGGEFLHWLMINIPLTCKTLAMGVPNNFKLANGAVQGINSFGRAGYGGPCPPPGEKHRYFFTVYALSAFLDPRKVRTAADLKREMDGKVVISAALMGFAQR